MISEQILLFSLIQKLEETKEKIHNDQDEYEIGWRKGFKAGIIETIGIILGKLLDYNLTAQEIRKIVIMRGIN